MRIRAPKNFWAGLMFIGFGVGFAVVAAQNYQIGTAVRMGPAYFPIVLGGLLALIGLAVLVQSLALDGPKVPPIVFRPLILILLATSLYGVLLRPLGLVLALFVLVGVGALGGRDQRAWEVGLLAIGLAAFSVFAFVKGLGLPFPIWPGE